MAKKTLEGFGTPTKNYGGAGMKHVGPIGGCKPIRPVGGNLGGVTGGGKAAGGDIKMKPVGGGKGISTSGKGPSVTLAGGTGMKTTEMGAMGKSGLGKKDVRETP